MGILIAVIGLPLFLLFSAVGFADDDIRAQIKAFKKAMKSEEEDGRVRAIARLAPIDDKAVSRELRKVVASDRSDRVRASAARALGHRGDRKDLSFLVRCLKSLKKRPVALAGAAEAVGQYAEPRTADALYDVGRQWLLKHKYPAQASIRALGKVPSLDAIESLIKLMELTYPRPGRGPGGENGNLDGSFGSIPGLTSDDTSATLSDYRPYLVASLQKLTGESLTDLPDWKEWWEQIAPDFDPSSVKDDPNRQFKLIDTDYCYIIRRPSGEWTWQDKAKKGFNRTAALKEGDRVSTNLHLLAYSTQDRAPRDHRTLAASEKEALLKSFTRISEQTWAEEVKFEETEGIRHTILGYVDGKLTRYRITYFKHRFYVYVLWFSLEARPSRDVMKDVESFEESLRFLK